jgi:hypothetical protein
VSWSVAVVWKIELPPATVSAMLTEYGVLINWGGKLFLMTLIKTSALLDEFLLGVPRSLAKTLNC